ncbi:MAG TPA: sulfurtransferase [Gammaproteobacteria bacterium]|nr:sulfurtransferase [Gammaproteobacteria bacterium]
MLTDAATLQRNLDQHEVILVDCRYRLEDGSAGRRAYHRGHIPGAYYLSLAENLAGPGASIDGRHPLPQPERFFELLRSLGITERSRLVAYDDQGGLMAARFWWLCRWVGHLQVELLNGGWQAWLAAGGEASSEVSQRPRSDYVPGPFNNLTVSAAALKRELAEGSVLLVDARSVARFRGEEEPIDTVAGHIPGAVNRPATQNLDAEGYFYEPARLRESWLSLLGDFQPDQVVHSCGSGVTACHNLFAMELAGLAGSRLYAPSWSGWIADPDNPCEV